ncbi:MAG: hypothetical protein QXN38_03085 [Desulfurococcaceae archaeon]
MHESIVEAVVAVKCLINAASFKIALSTKHSLMQYSTQLKSYYCKDFRVFKELRGSIYWRPLLP